MESAMANPKDPGSERLRDVICPAGHWELSPIMENLLQDQIRRLPDKTVSTEEGRHPRTSGGIRGFLREYFVRHFFQVQDSVLSLLTEGNLATSGPKTLHIIDIGCGPATASLAVTDLLGTLTSSSRMANAPSILQYTLNDVSHTK